MPREAGVRPRSGDGAGPRRHAEGVHVEVEQGLFLLTLGGVLLAERNDLAHDPGVEAVGLGLGVDFLDIAGDRLFVLIEPLDAFDEASELALGESCLGIHGVGWALVALGFWPSGWGAARFFFC